MRPPISPRPSNCGSPDRKAGQSGPALSRPFARPDLSAYSDRHASEPGSETELRRRLLDEHHSERLGVARDLHDNIAQRIALIAIDLDQIRTDSQAFSAEIRALIENVRQETDRLASEVQHLSHRLHPAKLKHIGIAAGLAGLCREFRTRHGIQAEFVSHKVPASVPEEVSLCLYRVLQDCLEDACKSGRAKALRAELWGTRNEIRLAISDCADAAVKNAAQPRSKIELFSIREQIAQLKGEWRAEEVQSGMIAVVVSIPLRNLKRASEFHAVTAVTSGNGPRFVRI